MCIARKLFELAIEKYTKPIAPGPIRAPMAKLGSERARVMKIIMTIPVNHFKPVNIHSGNSFHSQYSIPDLVKRKANFLRWWVMEVMAAIVME
ncbi:hypothetical protein D3C77_461600 [compost metagenome]